MPRQARFPRNHPSASRRLNVLRAIIRKEQDHFRCIVVDADIIDIWPEIFVSPFGVVDKGDGDPRTTGRVIHDLSYPDGESVNTHTDQTEVPRASFENCSSIAREIRRCQMEDPKHEVMVMAGDVASAYRNACTFSNSVHLFAGYIGEDNALIIDMSAAFGWTGSAGTYSILGGAVAFIHGSTGDTAHTSGFYNYHWVDDHVNVAVDVGSRCVDIDRSLRFAMSTVMGPSAVNDKKFTGWSTRQKVLGLEFDTKAATVSMPTKKINKAEHLVNRALHASKLTRSEYRSLLGSLRHVATCIRPAQAFLQRLRTGERLLHRCALVPINADMRDDLLWWRQILQSPSLNGVPLEYFDAQPEPEITIVTDSSDTGICALIPTQKLALSYKFSDTEKGLISAFKSGSANHFDINYRELLACAFAIQTWAPTRRTSQSKASPIHVHFRIDNTSAVAWQSKMPSRNPRAQILISLLCLWEHEYGLRLPASHIPGSENTAADAGSRRWESDAFSRKFDVLTQGWSQVPPPPSIAALESAWLDICANTRLPIRPSSPAQEHSLAGPNGQHDVASCGAPTSQ